MLGIWLSESQKLVQSLQVLFAIAVSLSRNQTPIGIRCRVTIRLLGLRVLPLMTINLMTVALRSWHCRTVYHVAALSSSLGLTEVPQSVATVSSAFSALSPAGSAAASKSVLFGSSK